MGTFLGISPEIFLGQPGPLLTFRVLPNLEIFPGIFLRISLENGASWLERGLRDSWISHETLLRDIPETLRNIHLLSQLAPFSRVILRNIPGNIPF